MSEQHIPARAVLIIPTYEGKDVGRPIITEVPWDQHHWGVHPVDGNITNTRRIEFPTAGEDVGAVDGVRILDADTGIDLGVAGFFSRSRLSHGDLLTFADGGLNFPWLTPTR